MRSNKPQSAVPSQRTRGLSGPKTQNFMGGGASGATNIAAIMKKFKHENNISQANIKEGCEKIKFIDSEHFLNKSIDEGKKVLGEGAQGSLLDIDFGTYPYVTSSNTTSAGACTGLGIAPNKINKVYGIFKAYTTRVGSGPFPTELFDSTGERMAKIGNEFGATTGRPRRCGWLDLVSLKHSITVNGVTDLIMMKGDVLSGIDKIKVCTKYNYNGEVVDYMPFSIMDENIEPIYDEIDGWEEDITQAKSYNDLPLNFKNYVAFLEDKLNLKIILLDKQYEITTPIKNPSTLVT